MSEERTTTPPVDGASMSDDRPPIPGELSDELAEIVEDMVSDPETRGFTFCGVGPELGAVAQSLSDGEYETHVALCAVTLKEHVAGLDVDGQEFVRDVLHEYNEREVSEERHPLE
jgi:hypothetical protein